MDEEDPCSPVLALLALGVVIAVPALLLWLVV
jgi:hypothetical protein